MKRFVILSLAVLMLFCSCAKKDTDSGFDIFTIPEGTPMLVLDTSTLDILPYERDNADLEDFLQRVNALGPEDFTSVEFIDYKEDTPYLTCYLERETTYIFKAWSFGEGECAIMLYMVGSDQPIYQLTYKSIEMSALIEKIYTDFRG